MVWLIGGDATDVDEFIEAIGGEEDSIPLPTDGDVIEMSRWTR